MLYSDKIQTKERQRGMDDTTLILLRDAAVRLIRNCTDEDLIDLVCKLLIESGVDTDPLGPDYSID